MAEAIADKPRALDSLVSADGPVVALDGYDILGYQAAIGAGTDEAHASIRSLLRGFGPVDVGPGLHLPRYELVPAGDIWQLRVNGDVAQEDKNTGSALGALEWYVLNAALAFRDDLLQLHGAALCCPTRRAAIVLSGDSGSGKTTLTLGLMLHGFTPYGDDVAVADRATLELQPVRRAFHFPDATRDVVETLRRGALAWEDDLPGFFSPPQWAERPAPIRWILFVEYKPDRTPELVRMSPAEAATAILGQTINLQRAARPTLAAVARLVESARVYRLLAGDLEETIAIVQHLVAGSTAAED